MSNSLRNVDSDHTWAGRTVVVAMFRVRASLRPILKLVVDNILLASGKVWWFFDFAQDGGKAKQAQPVSTFLNSNVISEGFALISTSTSSTESF